MPKPRDPQQYDEEYQALQATLEDYLREQVSLLADGGPAPPAAPESWWRRHRTDVYFVVTLALIGLLWWRGPAPAPPAGDAVEEDEPVQPTPSPPSPSAPAPPAAAVVRPDPPPGLDDPDAWWQGYVADHATVVADWLVAVSQARGLETGQVSPRQKGNFERWSSTIRTAASRDASLLASVRMGLFEYVYGRWSRNAGGETGKWERVDLVLDPAEYTSAGLEALAAELGREHWLETFDPEDRRLQTALVVGWIESHEP